MKELKFRAWHSGEKEMIPNCNQGFEGDAFNWKHQGQPIEIMQFINRKDKNGTEIYEGDIVSSVSGIPASGAIEWGCFGSPEFGVTSPYININNPEAVEVIGNIYENKELLEGNE